MVERVCGTPKDQFLQVCEAWTSASGRERTAALVYAVGWTHHSVGVQYIRSAAIIQLLLGNMGRPGGGIMAMRGHATQDDLPKAVPQLITPSINFFRVGCHVIQPNRLINLPPRKKGKIGGVISCGTALGRSSCSPGAASAWCRRARRIVEAATWVVWTVLADPAGAVAVEASAGRPVWLPVVPFVGQYATIGYARIVRSRALSALEEAHHEAFTFGIFRPRIARHDDADTSRCRVPAGTRYDRQTMPNGKQSCGCR